MSLRYKGAVISATPPTTSSSGAAGSWTLQQQMQAQAGGNWPFGGPFNYIEDVFSTYLYTGNGSTQTITNGVDLSGQGGLVWTKNRSTYSYGHQLFDTARGAGYDLATNSTAAQNYDTTNFSSFNSNGFTIGPNANANVNGVTNVSWTFRKQPKFFDVVTYTGDGSSSRNISHSLGSTPGFVVIKKTNSTGNWMCWHNSFAATDYIALNTTGAKNYAGSLTDIYKGVSSTAVTIGSNGVVNELGWDYVMYLFAHNAGGFGLTGTDNVISCGSYTSISGGNFIDLGYEAQFVIEKVVSSTSSWEVTDIMRGMSQTGVQVLTANTANAEYGTTGKYPTATGYYSGGWSPGATVIYIAIRRGPMKTPTSGTSVFSAQSFSDYNATVYTDIVTDFVINKVTYYNPDLGTYTSGGNYMSPRLAGSLAMQTNSTNLENSSSAPATWAVQTGFGWANGSGYNIFNWSFRRAPGFADVVCYTGAGSPTTVTHNLGVVPELMIIKRRDAAASWAVYSASTGTENYLLLDSTNGAASGSLWNSTTPTSTQFYVSGSSTVSLSGATYVAYLFASCPGVSKVGSYTGTGSTRTINCGFAAGARFVLIKRTDAAGNWFVYDTSRGMQSGNDPYLLLNSSNAAVTNTDYVDTDVTGFQLIGSGLNVNGGSYIFLAVS